MLNCETCFAVRERESMLNECCMFKDKYDFMNMVIIGYSKHI